MSKIGSKIIPRSKMPEGTMALFFIQVFSTLSYSVLYSTLVLYMIGKLGVSTSLANTITGVFVAINFALHLLGGFCGGRFLSNRALFCLGMLAQIVGCVLLSSESYRYLYFGLGFFLTGSGLNVTCINCMITQRFTPEDNRRETMFLWNYAGMNIGFFVGFTLSGYFQLTQNYHRLFLLSSLGNLISVFICLYCWHSLADINTNYARLTNQSKRYTSTLGALLVLALPFILTPLLHYATWASKLVIATGCLMLVFLAWLSFQMKSKVTREKMFAFLIFLIVATIFWMLYQIGPMGLTQFIENNVTRHAGSFIIPPQWFQNVNTICIVLGGPLLSIILNNMRTRGIAVNIPTQFALALLLIGLAFVVLPIGIARADENGMVSSGWVVACFILQSGGELLISPIGYAMVGALAPSSLQGIMMGMWMLATGVGATLSSYSSNWMTSGQESNLPLLTNNGYSTIFLNLGILAIVASFLLFLFVPLLRSWIENKNKSLCSESLSMPV